MSAVAAPAAAPERTWADRLLAAVPVVSLFVWLCLLYAWESWGHKTPWLFTDELEFAQLARSIADTGQAARRGDPHSFNTLYTYLTSPAWLASNTHTAYAIAKYIGVATMAAVVFPVYGLARMLVGRPAALFAAAAAGAIPSLAYSSMLVEEPLAYPWAALCFFLLARALTVRSRVSIAAAAAACVVAPLVRGELALFLLIGPLAALSVYWGSWSFRSRRRSWSAWDWTGAVVLAAGALIVFSAVVSDHSYSWLVTTRYYKERMLEYGLWAGGALTIGLGVLPVLAGLASLSRPRHERTPAFRAFAALLWTSLVAFGMYTAVKAAYLSTVFATRVEERNLIYLAPLLLVGTALWLERPRVRLVPLAAAVALVAWMLVDTPYQLDAHLYSDALGLAILQMFNRNLAVDPGIAQWIMIGILLFSVALLLLPRFVRARAAVLAVVGLAAVLTLSWNVAGEVSAAQASNSFSRDFARHLPDRLTWLDDATRGQPALYLGQQVGDANGIWELEFWNRSLRRVWSLDGTAPGPGPTLTPDLSEASGRLFPDPGFPYVVADNGVELDGEKIPNPSQFTLYRVRPPLRLAQAVTGIMSDGWAGTAPVAYSKYSTPSGRAGWLVVNVYRKNAWCGPDVPSPTTVRLGTLVVGGDKQPAIGRVTAVRKLVVHACEEYPLVFRTPAPPFRVEVVSTKAFVPHELDPNVSDARELTAKVNFAFSETRPRSR